MKKGWYILVYHDISWEENPYVRGIGGTCPPDIFREHIKRLSGAGNIISISEGLNRLITGNITHPMFSIWFDDGLAGPRKYALPILQRNNQTAAISVCSRFINRSEFFWRFKLSYLSYVDGLRFLRTRLRKYGFQPGMLVKDFCLSNFSESIVEEIDGVFQKFTSEQERQDAFRLFENERGLLELRENGWTIANHTAAHYPIGEDVFVDNFHRQFVECEEVFQKMFNEKSKFWVLPFGDPGKKAKEIARKFKQHNDSTYLVLVGNKINSNSNVNDNTIFRINVPVFGSHDLIRYLGRIQYNRKNKHSRS